MKIFLDIDGVMVHANSSKRVELEDDGFYRFNKEATKHLNSLLEYNNYANEIIISSSHRHRYNVDEWKQIFLKRNIRINNLSIMDLSFTKYKSRKEEIFYWIEYNHLRPSEFIILDDDKSLNGLPASWKERLILTNPYIGLNNEAFEKISNLLSVFEKIDEVYSRLEKIYEFNNRIEKFSCQKSLDNNVTLKSSLYNFKLHSNFNCLNLKEWDYNFNNNQKNNKKKASKK